MAPRKDKASEGEKLRKKRERERERRKKIREDPVKREEQRQKEHEKYLRQKRMKIKKNVSDMTSREQRVIRRRWRINSKSYRLRNKQIQIENIILQENTPPPSDEENNERVSVLSKSRREAGRKLANRNKAKRYKEKRNLTSKLAALQKQLSKYKKRYNRLKEQIKEQPMKRQKKNDPQNPSNPEMTPGTRVGDLLKNTGVDQSKVDVVKKSLLFGEVVKDQLSETYKTLKSNRAKQIFKKIINGKVIEKYKMKTKFSVALKYRKTPKYNVEDIMKYERKEGTSKLKLERLRKRIQFFLEQDINSRLCPGKKEFVTRNKISHQKRFLANTLKNLYQDYLRKYPNPKISYRFFCRARPFWVQQMKVVDRDTCKCVIHSNMELIVQSLYSNKVLSAKTPSQVIRDICCNDKTEKCLLRQCSECKESKVIYNDFDRNDKIEYFQWVTLKQKYTDKKTKTTKVSTKTAKQPQELKMFELITKFETKLRTFMAHEARIIHQYNVILKLKENLKKTKY